ncbi:MAG: site-specific DNA-methyltransferase [Chitinivibrionales bacterium]|nr:site-specific DNA-methyltransferase [Chitinivibrionales bacterium]
MQTTHKIITADSRKLDSIPDNSIDLVVTSPPYPMIRMWDEIFSALSSDTKKALEKENGDLAFETMHKELDKTWKEAYRVLKDGSFACVNIGDAVRTIGGRFKLYSNHSRIITSFRNLGFDCLPVILWRKQTNAPNKFMGSGMLPSGAYVTLEHEYILIFRKGAKKIFKSEESKQRRMESAFFREERNTWFSDVWDFKGTTQRLVHSDLRERSGAYPLELAYRLINMYSLYGDTVLDPFLGTGTTMLAALACARNSIGVEIDKAFSRVVLDQTYNSQKIANSLLAQRIIKHRKFVDNRLSQQKGLKYKNIPHGFPVMTRQEVQLCLKRVSDMRKDRKGTIITEYENLGEMKAD